MVWVYSMFRPQTEASFMGEVKRKRRIWNQSIIDFFKPASKQDRHMLDSPQKSNIKYEGSGLSITGTEKFERKLSSPKKSKPKRMPSEKSPILEAFMKGTIKTVVFMNHADLVCY
ncbi:SMC5-SMC6 complex localization factor protein 2-like isoform X2 [Tamandua tetradactyla]|uniref:SMC5-SMC6 complex localization factor protein 2-like isoform X2 n=1 Tax=Tamandua tetradactyla TaxID=48850 RepID=UPI0040538E7E